ncbi:MAG: hypothetical protein QOH64_2681 [Acidimicrobiaceae bacterium]
MAGWSVGAEDLDGWLAERGQAPAAERLPILTYGSNRCPSKITWLRRELGLPGAVVVLRAWTHGLAAVWAAGFRLRDGQRPAVLAAAPGVVEQHAVWLATPEQVSVLDHCEGRDERYRLARLHTGEVHTEDGAVIRSPWCYLGYGDIRRPLLVDGVPVRCADVDEGTALDLRGQPAQHDGLDATASVGAPPPDEWPASLFVYGLLQPGESAWLRVAEFVDGTPSRARLPGTVLDTGLGWPTLLLGEGPGAPGWVLPLRDPAALLPELDAFEGPGYRRVRVVLPDTGEVCWAYATVAPTDGMRPLPNGWPPDRSDRRHPD